MATLMLGSMAPAVPEGYLTIRQAVTETGISRETLFRWIRVRKIGSYKVGGIRDTLVKRDELRAQIDPQPR